jgi:hypothetical protein
MKMFVGLLTRGDPTFLFLPTRKTVHRPTAERIGKRSQVTDPRGVKERRDEEILAS